MKLRWTDRARRDLGEIARYISADNPSAARRWIDVLRARARSAVEFPLIGRVVPEMANDELREILVGAYRIVYRVVGDAVVVVTVFEEHRLLNPEDIPKSRMATTRCRKMA
jgi:addiction module RelE/StbE family toxin